MNFPFKLRDAAAFDVIGFGTNAVDHLIRVPAYPGFNTKVELTSYELAAGGEVASTLTGLQRLGMVTAYAGRFGSDREGELGLKSLVDEGVDVTHAEIVEEARTQIAFILIDDRSGERTVIWHRDQRLSYGQTDPPVEIATRGRILHMTTHDADACVKLARAARSAGVIVSVDVDRAFEGIETLLPLVDICIGSADFAHQLLGLTEHASALAKIAERFGCPVVGLTLGDAGSIFMCDNELILTPGFAVPGGCVDTTGAGDAFRTGFLYGVLSHASVEETAATANAVAALKCRSAGARRALPTRDELHTFLK
ncbi:MAG: carbohydrate kinase family protein [Pyrinomonadaceae bacterium]